MTTARATYTYGQIGLFTHDKRLPDFTENATAGTGANKDAYDYGVFRFNDLMAQALDEKDYLELPKTRQDYIYERARWAISDPMPAWIRLPRPKA